MTPRWVDLTSSQIKCLEGIKETLCLYLLIMALPVIKHGIRQRDGINGKDKSNRMTSILRENLQLDEDVSFVFLFENVNNLFVIISL